jgi:hypothetical protein
VTVANPRTRELVTRLAAVLLAVAACNSTKKHANDCHDQAVMGDGKLPAVKACAPLYADGCKDALAGVTTVGKDTLTKIVAACRKAYPKLDASLDPGQLLARALDGTPDIHDVDAIGHALEIALRPPAIAIHLTSSSIAIDHGKTYQVAPTPEAVQPALADILAQGGATGGVIIWGRYEAPEMYEAIMPALHDVPTVICQRDGANCK